MAQDICLPVVSTGSLPVGSPLTNRLWKGERKKSPGRREQKSGQVENQTDVGTFANNDLGSLVIPAGGELKPFGRRK